MARNFTLSGISCQEESDKVGAGGDKTSGRQVVRQRKLEYRRKEKEGNELLIATPGAYIGMTDNGLSVKSEGKCIHKCKLQTLKHITVASSGVSISSNAISYCMSERIPIDFFDSGGKHYASVLSPKYIESSLWAEQMSMDDEKKRNLAKAILTGKIKNQHNLMKYYNKYHKSDDVSGPSCFDKSSEAIREILCGVDSLSVDNWQETLVGMEAQAASAYWDYVRYLLSDDGVVFEKRERRGAGDLYMLIINVL